MLAQLLAEHAAGTTLTRSELEERSLGLCRERGLPEPVVNGEVQREAKVVVEVDGRASHDTRRGSQDDRDRDTLLAAHGYVTRRFTWWDVVRRPAVVAHRVEEVLRRRRREGAAS